MNEFLSAVAERPDWTLTVEHVCPYCGAEPHTIDSRPWSHISMSGPVKHYHTGCQCRICGRTFTHHYREHHNPEKVVHWYDDGGNRIIQGIPTCWGEFYRWTCAKCGGPVTVTRQQGGFLYRFVCDACDNEVLSENNSFCPPPESPNLNFDVFPVRTSLTVLGPDDPKARTIGFSVTESLDIETCNLRGSNFLELSQVRVSAFPRSQDPVDRPTTTTPREMVVALPFSEDDELILLVRKEGLLTGLGGKIEEGETPVQAVRRELRRKTELDAPDKNIQHIVTLRSRAGHYVTHFFAVYNVPVGKGQPMTGPYEVHKVTDVSVSQDTIQNLRWIIPLALDDAATTPIEVSYP